MRRIILPELRPPVAKALERQPVELAILPLVQGAAPPGVVMRPPDASNSSCLTPFTLAIALSSTRTTPCRKGRATAQAPKVHSLDAYVSEARPARCGLRSPAQSTGNLCQWPWVVL